MTRSKKIHYSGKWILLSICWSRLSLLQFSCIFFPSPSFGTHCIIRVFFLISHVLIETHYLSGIEEKDGWDIGTNGVVAFSEFFFLPSSLSFHSLSISLVPTRVCVLARCVCAPVIMLLFYPHFRNWLMWQCIRSRCRPLPTKPWFLVVMMWQCPWKKKSKWTLVKHSKMGRSREERCASPPHTHIHTLSIYKVCAAARGGRNELETGRYMNMQKKEGKELGPWKMQRSDRRWSTVKRLCWLVGPTIETTKKRRVNKSMEVSLASITTRTPEDSTNTRSGTGDCRIWFAIEKSTSKSTLCCFCY